MCRNIRVLYNFEPPTTRDEIRSAASQFVRKVSGLARPSAADAATFERAINEVAISTERLLNTLSARTTPRTREHEQERAHARWTARLARLPAREDRTTGTKSVPPQTKSVASKRQHLK